MNEWESQQIRKAISGSQLMNAQQEAYSHFLIREGSNDSSNAVQKSSRNLTTKTLLEQAYASSNIQKSQSMKSNQKSEKKAGPRMPHEVLEVVRERLKQVKELITTHLSQIQKITNDMNVISLEELECEQNAPVVASKFRFYQELKGYVYDLIECYDEKLPKINELERKHVAAVVKYSNYLIERRRQDVRDQAREVTQAQSKFDCLNFKCGIHLIEFVLFTIEPSNVASMNAAARKEEEQRVTRAAEREGRRTRRRRGKFYNDHDIQIKLTIQLCNSDRERRDTPNDHLDGMSSDDEIPDHESTLYKNQLSKYLAMKNIHS